jgi:hypothetical protein
MSSLFPLKGGSVLACLQPNLELKTYRTDFDLFLYGLNEVTFMTHPLFALSNK